MNKKDFDRASWFLEACRNETFPSSTDLAQQFSVAAKTAARLIYKLRKEYEAPLSYSHAKRGYVLDDPEFMLPCNCRLSKLEMKALSVSIKRCSEVGQEEELEALKGLLQRLGG